MLRYLKWVLPSLAAVGLVACIAVSSAKAAEEKSTIKGKVVDKDGKAASGVEVRLVKPRQRGAGGGGGGGGARPEPLATAKSADDGTFTLEFDKAKVPEGTYSLTAMAGEQGSRTFARAQIKVDKDGKADPDKDVELKLQAGGRRGGGGGGGGGQ